ncbi:MAG: effector-associated domain EAD1-containing protein, partial [Rhizonema sp. PD37]|nr:effector-associated domain EAD1-containing protein [Rhizonema sp. PD37]
MQLSGKERKQLQEALINAFPNTASLEQMLVFELEKTLRVIVCEGSLQETVFKLIETAISEGWITNLISAAYNCNPGNLK